MVGLTFSTIVSAQQKVVHADNSGLPMIDYSKQFDIEGTAGIRGNMESKVFDSKAANLPEYAGKLETLSIPTLQPGHAEGYSHLMKLKDIEIKKAVDKWSRITDADYKDKAFSMSATSVFEKTAVLDERNADQYTKEWTVEAVEQPHTIRPEDLPRVINKGGKTGTVRVGGGFGGQSLDLIKETPERPSPRK